MVLDRVTTAHFYSVPDPTDIYSLHYPTVFKSKKVHHPVKAKRTISVAKSDENSCHLDVPVDYKFAFTSTQSEIGIT